MMAIQPPPDDPRKRAYTSLKDLGLQRAATAAQDPTFTPLAMQGILRQQGLMPPMRKQGIAPEQYRSPLGLASAERAFEQVKRDKMPVYDTYSGWKNELGGIAHGGFFGGLSLLAKPLSIVASTAKETLDLFQGEGFSPQDWWEQADLLGDDFYSFGRLLADEDWLQDRGSLFQLTMPVGWLGNVFGKDWDDWHWDVTPSFLVAAPFDLLGDPLAWMTLGLGKFGQIAHAIKTVGTRGISKKILDRGLKSSLDDAFWRTGFVADKATLDSLPKIADQLLDGAGWAIGKSDDVAKQGLWKQSREEIHDHIKDYLSGNLAETTGFAGFVQDGEKIAVKLGSRTIDDIAELAATEIGVRTVGVARGLTPDGAQRVARLMQEFGLDDMFRSAAEFGGLTQFAGRKAHRPLFEAGADMTRRGNRVQRQLGLRVPMTGNMGRTTVNKAIGNLNRNIENLDGLLSRVGALQVPELTKPMGLVLVSGSSKWLDNTIRAIPRGLQWAVADKMGVVGRGVTRGLLGGKGGEVLLKGQVTEAIPILKGKKGFQYPWRAGAVDETAQKKAVEILQRRSLKDIVRDKSLDPFLRIGAKEVLRAFGRGNAVWRKAEAVLGRNSVIALKRLDDIGIAAGRKSMDPEWGEMLFKAGSLAGSPAEAAQRALIGDEAWEIMMEIFPTMKAMSEDMAGMVFIKERPWYMPHQLDLDAARYVEGKSNGRIRFDPAGLEKKRLYLEPSEVEAAVKRYATAQGEKKPWGQLSQKEQEAWRAAHAKQPKAETSFFMEEELFDRATIMPDGLEAGDIPEQILNIMNRHGIDHGLFNRNFFEVLPTYTQTLAKRTGEVHVEQILRSKGVLSDRWIAGIQLPPVEVMNAARTLRVKLVRADKARKELLDRIKEAANDERAAGLYRGAEVKAAVKVEEAATREVVAAQAVADEMNAALIVKQEEFVVAISQLEAVEARIAVINDEIALRWPRGPEGKRLKMPRKEATRKFNEVKRLLAKKHELEDQIRRLEFGDPKQVAILDTGTVYGGLWDEARTAVSAKVFLERVLITTFNDIETARKFAVWYAQQWDETIRSSVGVQAQLFPTAEGARGGSDIVDAMRRAGLTFETTAADGTVVRVSAEEGSKALDLIGQALDDQGIGQWLAYDNLDEFMPSGAEYRGGSAIVMRALDDINGLVAEKIGKLEALLVKYTKEVPDLLPTVYMAVPDDVRDIDAGLQAWLEDEIKRVMTEGTSVPKAGGPESLETLWTEGRITSAELQDSGWHPDYDDSWMTLEDVAEIRGVEPMALTNEMIDEGVERGMINHQNAEALQAELRERYAAASGDVEYLVDLMTTLAEVRQTIAAANELQPLLNRWGVPHPEAVEDATKVIMRAFQATDKAAAIATQEFDDAARLHLAIHGPKLFEQINDATDIGRMVSIYKRALADRHDQIVAELAKNPAAEILMDVGNQVTETAATMGLPDFVFYQQFQRRLKDSLENANTPNLLRPSLEDLNVDLRRNVQVVEGPSGERYVVRRFASQEAMNVAVVANAVYRELGVPVRPTWAGGKSGRSYWMISEESGGVVPVSVEDLAGSKVVFDPATGRPAIVPLDQPTMGGLAGTAFAAKFGEGFAADVLLGNAGALGVRNPDGVWANVGLAADGSVVRLQTHEVLDAGSLVEATGDHLTAKRDVLLGRIRIAEDQQAVATHHGQHREAKKIGSVIAQRRDEVRLIDEELSTRLKSRGPQIIRHMGEEGTGGTFDGLWTNYIEGGGGTVTSSVETELRARRSIDNWAAVEVERADLLTGRITQTGYREFAHDATFREFFEYAERTGAAEKSAVDEPFSAEATRLSKAEPYDWEEFSRARGYTEEEISDFRRYLKMEEKVRAAHPDDPDFTAAVVRDIQQTSTVGEFEAISDLMRAMDYARTLPRNLADGVDDRMAQIIEIHRLVTQHDPNQFFAPRPSEEFKKLVENSYPLDEASATYAHDVDNKFLKRFVDIAPFGDSNNRVASVLRNHLLPMDEGGLAYQLLPDYHYNDPWTARLAANQNVQIEVGQGLGVTLWDTPTANGGLTEAAKDAVVEAMGIDSPAARDRKLMYISWGLTEEALEELPELMTHGIPRSADGVAAWQVGDINFIDDMVRDGSIPADVIADNHPFWSNPEIAAAIQEDGIRGKRRVTADDFRIQYEEWKLRGEQENRFPNVDDDYEQSLRLQEDVDQRGGDSEGLWDDMGDEYLTGAGDDLYDMIDDPLDREVIEATDLAIGEGEDVGSVLDPTRTLRKATGTEKMDNARLVLNGLRVLKKMLKEIDDEGITIFATVSATVPVAGTDDHLADLAVTLRKWYAKYGFKQIGQPKGEKIWYIVRPAKRQPPMGRAPLDFKAYIGPEAEMGGSANLMYRWDEMIRDHNGSMVDRVRTQVEDILAVRERFGGWHALVKSAVPDGTDEVAIKNIAKTLERRTSELADRFGLNYREGHELWSSSAESATFNKGELLVMQREQIGLKGTEAATIQPSAVAGRAGVIAPEGSEYLPWIDGNAVDTTLVPSDQVPLFEHGRIRSADLGEGQGLRIDIGSGRRIKVYGIRGDRAIERANHRLLEIGDPSRGFDSSVTGAMDDLIEDMPRPYGQEVPFSAVTEQGRLASDTAEMTLDILDRAGDDLLDELIGFVENVSPRNVAAMARRRSVLAELQAEADALGRFLRDKEYYFGEPHAFGEHVDYMNSFQELRRIYWSKERPALGYRPSYDHEMTEKLFNEGLAFLDNLESKIKVEEAAIKKLAPQVEQTAWIRQARTIMATPELASLFPAASLEQQRGLFREVLEFVAWRNDHYSPQLVKRDVASLHDMIATYFAYRNPALNPDSYAWHVAKAEQSAAKYSNDFMKNVHIRYMEHQEGIATGVWHDRVAALESGRPYVITEGGIELRVSHAGRGGNMTGKEFGLEGIPYDQQVVIGWGTVGESNWQSGPPPTAAQNAAFYRKGLEMVGRVVDELNAEGFYVFAIVDSGRSDLRKSYARRKFIRSDIDVPLDDEFSGYQILKSEIDSDDLDFWISLHDGDMRWESMTGAERARWNAIQDRTAELIGPEGLYPAHGLEEFFSWEAVDESIPIVRGPKGQTLKEMRASETVVLRPHLARTPEESVIGRLWTQYQLSLAGDGYVGTARVRGQRNPITHYADDPVQGPVYGVARMSPPPTPPARTGAYVEPWDFVDAEDGAIVIEGRRYDIVVNRMADVDQLTDEGANAIVNDLAAASQTPSPVAAAQNAGMKYHVEVRLTNPLGAKIVPPELTPASLLDPEQAALHLDQQAAELVPPEQFQKAFREEAIEAISTDYGVAALERRRALLDNPLEEAVANQQTVTDDLFLMEQQWSETLENLVLLERARGDSVEVRQMAQHAADRHGRLVRALAKLQTLEPEFKFKKGGVGAVSDAYADLESAIMQIGMADLEEAKMMLNVLNDDFDNALEILRDASGGMGALRNLPEAEIIFEQSFQSGMRPVGTGSQGPAALVDSIVLADAYNARGGVRGFFRYYDKTHNLWKGYAVLSPGFWSRNFMGGLFMNYLHGVSSDSYGRFLSALRYLRAEQALARGEITAAQSRKLQAGMGKRAGDIEIVRQLDRGGLFGAGQAGVEFISHTGPRRGTVVIGGRVINLNSANPFSSQFLPLRGGLTANVGVETMLRGSMGFDVMAKGGMIDEAADMIFKYHFDYDDLTWFERKVIKRVVPFYTWTRKSLPLIIEQFAIQPIKFQRYRQTMDAIGSAEKDRSDFGVVPDWMVRQGALPLGAKFGDEHMWMIPDLPVKSFYEIVNAPLRDDLTPMGRIEEVGQALSSMVSPLIKAPVEVYTKRNIWKGYNFEGRFEYVPRVFSNVPFLMEALEGVGVARKAGNDEWVMRDNYLHGIAQLLPTFSQARRLFPDEERYQKRLLSSWMSFAFGLGLRTNTQWEQEQELRGRYYEDRDKQRDLRDVQNVREGAR